MGGLTASGARFLVVVMRTAGDCHVCVGMTSKPLMGTARIGRDPECDFQLYDPTISSRHLSVALRPGGFEITNDSRHGTTLVDHERVEPGETRQVDGEVAWAQVGRILLRISAESETVPVDQVIEIPGSEQAPLLIISSMGSRSEVRCRGQAVALLPSAARVLRRLCETPGAVVSHFELSEAADPEQFPRAGGTQLAQLMTAIRTMLANAVRDGILEQEDLAELAEADSTLPIRELLLQVVENVRGAGYRIRLPARAVVIQRL